MRSSLAQLVEQAAGEHDRVVMYPALNRNYVGSIPSAPTYGLLAQLVRAIVS